mmetsp:Transcript_29551/g.45108  ORF Transcript_29551/g.45108 Transcript_29551/m.45108 type:complete len:93 (+) Transcript_29551:2284-2562(+)
MEQELDKAGASSLGWVHIQAARLSLKEWNMIFVTNVLSSMGGHKGIGQILSRENAIVWCGLHPKVVKVFTVSISKFKVVKEEQITPNKTKKT